MRVWPLTLETGMSVVSEPKRVARQSGITLFEMLLAVAILSLLIGLTLNGSLSSLRSKSSVESVRRDLNTWYAQVRGKALYESQPHRVCLRGQRAVLENWSRTSGWQSSEIFYMPRPEVTMVWSGKNCSVVLNDGEDNFIQRVSFHAAD